MGNVYNLISEAIGGNVIFGVPATETEDTVVSLSMGESEESRAYLGTPSVTARPTVNLTVYSKDYISGLIRFEEVKMSLLSNAVLTAKILHKQDKSSSYDKDLKKHVFTAQYRILN